MTAPGSRRRLRRPTRWAAVLTMVLFGLSVTLSSLLTPTAIAADGTDPVQVVMSRSSASTLTPETRYWLQGSVRNNGTTPLTSLEIRLRVDWPVLDPAAMAAWESRSDDQAAGVVWISQQLPAALGPGKTASFRLEGPTSALGLPLSADAFGPRGTALEVLGSTGRARQRLAMQRSFLVWSPVADRPVTSLAVLAPLTSDLTATHPAAVPADPRGPIPDPVVDRWGTAAGDRWAHQWADDGRLRRIMTATTDSSVDWLIDPALISAADAVAAAAAPTGTPSPTTPSAAGKGVPPTHGSTPAAGAAHSPSPGSVANPPSAPTTAGSESPATAAINAQNAARWNQDLSHAAQGREVYALPWGDPDLLALGQAKAGGLLLAGLTDAAAVSSKLFGREIDTSLLWPDAGVADRDTVELIAGSRGRTLLLAPTTLAVSEPGASAADALVSQSGGPINLPGGRGNTALIADPALGSAVADLASTDPLAAQQRALAAIAARSLTADPANPPSLVAAMPRDWDPSDPAAMQASLGVLRTVPWLRLQHLSDLRRLTTTTKSTRFVPLTETEALPTSHINAVAQSLSQLNRFRTVLTDPNVTYNPLRSTALSLLSVDWRRGDLNQTVRSTALADARIDVSRSVESLTSAVQVETDYSGQLLSATGSLPVTVTSTLQEPVRVELMLHPNSGQLIVGDPQVVTIDAATPGETARASVSMPVKAVANGRVEVTASLSAVGSSEPLIVASEPIRLRVQPQWETRFFAVGGGLLALLLVAGLIRSVRRGRRSRIPTELVPDPDDMVVTSSRRRHHSATESPVVPNTSTPTEVQITHPSADENRHMAGAGFHDRSQSTRGVPVTSSMQHTEEHMSPDPDRPAESAEVPVPATRVIPVIVQVPPTRSLDIPISSHPGARAAGMNGFGTDGPTSDPNNVMAARDPETAALEALSLEAAELTTGAGDPDPVESTSVMRNSAVMTVGTLFSRILGLIRMVVLSAAIGAGGKLAADAFAVANTLPNQMYILIAGGVLNAILVPQIVRAAKREDGGTDYIDRLVTLSVLVLAIATILITAASPLLINVLGRRWDPATLTLAIAFAYWCVPQMFFYGMYTVFGQILTARGSFAPYMWAPIANNIVAIAGLVAYIMMVGGGERAPAEWTTPQIVLLAGTATAGVVVQTLVLIPALRRVNYHWTPRWGWRGIGLRTAGSVAMWVFAGVALAQLGFIGVITPVLSAAGKASSANDIAAGRTVFDNAYAIFMLPHSLITVSLVTATFPHLSQLAADRDLRAITANLSLALRTVAVATVFATAAGLVLATEATATMFQGTRLQDTTQYGLVTGALLLGVVPYSAQYLFQRVSFAFEDAKTPFWVGLINTGVWALGTWLASLVLPPRYVVVGCGLSLAVASLASAMVWVPVTKRRLGSVDGYRLLASHARLGLAGLGAALVGWLVKQGVYAQFGQTRFSMMIILVVAGSVMLMTYLLLLRAMRVPELNTLVDPLLRRARRR